MEKGEDHSSSAYDEYMDYVNIEIDRVQNEVPNFTYKDFQFFDSMNMTINGGIKYFFENYTPGKTIVDIGAGLGGPARLLNQEYGAEVIGLEYRQGLVDLSKKIDIACGLPNMLRQADATASRTDIENFDSVICVNTLNAIPRPSHQAVLDNAYSWLKPGGYFYGEDYSLDNLIEEFPEILRNEFEAYGHIGHMSQYQVLRQQLKNAGFNIIEYRDILREWSEGTWNRSEEYFIPIIEGERAEYNPMVKKNAEYYGLRNPRIMSDLEHMTSEQIREKFPKTSKYLDPDVWVHGFKHGDLKVVRFVAQKPLN